jgi:hypothetical protein
MHERAELDGNVKRIVPVSSMLTPEISVVARSFSEPR